jgi:hypothetical protein
MTLFVGDFRLEQSAQFSAIRSGQFGGVMDVHQNGLILPGQVMIKAVDKGWSAKGC